MANNDLVFEDKLVNDINKKFISTALKTEHARPVNNLPKEVFIIFVIDGKSNIFNPSLNYC